MTVERKAGKSIELFVGRQLFRRQSKLKNSVDIGKISVRIVCSGGRDTFCMPVSTFDVLEYKNGKMLLDY